MIRERLRVWECEPCLRCKAKRGKPCKNYKGQRKATCRVLYGCRRCCAQWGKCRCGGEPPTQGELFAAGSSAWIPPTLDAIVGRTGDDQRRSVK